ncbi:E3 ubiquitin-protein ligase DMA2 [Penicillium verhagenii]|uniref:E3 ubiquitin-protein ligase DMA2 n=1 Tax=Penicillium verhagenii TaxID=1562060 RepID=UPI002544E8B4|nr:E3 ubiquitin-protein ligase DMA2 [Penicillium verhagenii]KAJ5918968.1 E3 ubiquitin-protein ligase DMA2 [Penicillium verhagenii]
MSASTATASTVSDSPRPGRLRRLSQLRAYTQNLSSPTGQRARNSLSSRIPWLSPTSSDFPQSQGTSTSCPDDHSLSRYTSAPSPTSRPDSQVSVDSAPPDPNASGMARLRSVSAVSGRAPRLGRTTVPEALSQLQTAPVPPPATTPSPEPPTASEAPDLPITTLDAQSPATPKQRATIRFFPYQDTYQNSRPSLPFVPVARTLPSESCVIRVGRYSERDGIPIPNPTEPSDAPVGFKSKVVSRKHCEFMYVNGQWHVKDVGSSSGTFLNHMRLSQPNMQSRLYTIKDGDIVQLGIDFRGGEEMIFRCVRIRIECNRSWQQQPNEFNKNTESLINNLGKGETADYAGCRECSICLGSVLRPYQCLFMAACAHVWHYKCISRLLHSPDYPMFQCPNCRAFTDLSAEVDDSNDYEPEKKEEKDTPAIAGEIAPEPRSETQSPANTSLVIDTHQQDIIPEEPDLVTDVENLHLNGQRPDVDTEDSRSTDSPAPNGSHDDLSRSATNIPGWQPTQPLNVPISHLRADTPVRSETSDDNPLTPRNDSGPLAFDGRAGMQ